MAGIGDTNFGELTAIIDAQRVFEELGSRKECQILIDSPPRLLFEDEVSLRLNKRTNKLRRCKVYIFDDYFIVATRKRRDTSRNSNNFEGDTTRSSKSGHIWFGSEKSDTESLAEDVFQEEEDSESGLESVLDYRDTIRKEEEAKKEYNLKMWVELGKIKPRFLRTDGVFGVSIVYVSKMQQEVGIGEYRYNTIVDRAEIWMENESVAKNILGLIQDVVDKKARDMIFKINAEMIKDKERQKSLNGENSETDGESVTSGDAKSRRRSSAKLSTKSGGSKTLRTKRRRKEGIRNKKRSLKLLMTHQSLSEEARKGVPHISRTYEDLQAKYAVFDLTDKVDEFYIADEDEGRDAEFAVHFRGPDLGIDFQDAPNIEPFVGKLAPHGLALASGVTFGDRVVAINDIEITVDHSYNDVRNIIAESREEDPQAEIIILFRRKQKTEQARIKREIEIREANEKAILAEQTAEDSSDEGAVDPIEDNSQQESDPSRANSVEFRRKTEDGSINPRYTLVKTTKGKGKRKWHRKKKFLDKMQELNVGNFEEFRKNKSKLFERFENIASLFDTVKEYSSSKEEMNCIFALKEIYEIEDKYNGYLNHLKGIQRQLLGARKQVVCKHLRSGRPFCEHMRPRRFCSQASSVREEAIDHRILNSMFLNLTSIIKTNQFLWKSLQTGLGELYDKAAKHEKVEIYEMLEVFCEVFKNVTPFLQMYWAYCNRLNEANEYQRQLRADNPFFREIIKPIEKKIGIKLPNLLVKPLQQSMRYHLLFGTLEKHVKRYLDKGELTEEHNKRLKKAYKQIQTAHGSLVALGDKINKLVGESHANEEFLEIYDEIGGAHKVPNLMEPSRQFISKTYIMYEDCNQDLTEEQSFVYLFNDKIVVAVARPLPSGRGSKFSLAFRVGNILGGKGSSKKRLSIESTATDKKLSIPKKGGVKGDTLKKRISLRLSHGRGKASESVRMSTTSKDSKGSKDDIDYDIIQNFSIKNISSIEPIAKKQDECDLFGINLNFTSKPKKSKKIIKKKFFMWFDLRNMRDDLILEINKAKAEFFAKRKEDLRIRNKMQKDGLKKNSAMPKDKRSLVSTGSKKLGN